ncbi:MAG: ribonuclease R [Chlamydiales bacterium]|jgi:ribonuclease R
MGADSEQPSFKSFKDLARSLGGAQAEPEEVDSSSARGWTLETGDGPQDDAAIERLPDPEHGVRSLIARRPSAYGPMLTGPPCYADSESEEVELLHSFRLRTRFPDDVLQEMNALPADPAESEFAGRVDLRGKTIFTIDGADAKDYDDAIGIRELDDGDVEIGVHIADVGHYVRPGTALDAEALARGTSVYLPDQVIPMLPEEISNNLCSLVPNRDRLAYSVIMVFDAKGARKSARVHKSVIRSMWRNTYRVVQALLDDDATPETEEIKHLEGPLRLFERWTRTQQKLRDARGSLRIQSTEKKFLFDEQHEVCEVVDAARYFSQTLIEETALAANQAVGDLFRTRGLPTIYRVHPEKDSDEIEAVAKLLLEHGIRVPGKERLSGRDIGRMIRAARRRPNADALIGRIMGLVERAQYEVKDHEDVAQHFGLAREAYLHFTSPIRRYPDLIVHRWLHAIEERASEAEDELRTDDLLADLNDMATHCSIQSDLAQMAEIAVKDLKVCQFLEPQIGKKLAAKVQRVSRGGIEVHLIDFNVSGFVPARAIGDRPILKGPTLTIQAGKRMLSFTEGYPIAVVVKDVDFVRLQVILEVA